MKKLAIFGMFFVVAMLACTDYQRPGELALEWVEGIDSESESPISLTASDGTGLKMVSLGVKAAVQEPLAFTELHMVFENPEDRQREGRFEITLPPGAAISRFAMKIGDSWQEAEVVERQAARRAYEDFLHRKQDPALLEKKAGNQFRARVFPIPARAKKELILSYSQELKGEPFTVPLQGLPKLDTLEVEVLEVSGGGARPARDVIKEKNITPKKDLAFIKAKAAPGGTEKLVGLRSGDLALARVKLELEAAPEPLGNVTVLLDTSASRALGFERQIDRLVTHIDALEKKNGKAFPLRVVCFDQDVIPIYKGDSSKFEASAKKTIVERHALGASDLEKALAWLGDNPDNSTRLILVSDGIATAGEQGSDDLKKLVKKLGGQGVERLDVVVDGGIRNETLLKQLTNAGLPQTGVVVDAGIPSNTLATKLTSSTYSNIDVSVRGADWVWPKQLDGVQNGDEFVVYAGLPKRETAMNVGLKGIWSKERVIKTEKAHEPLIERASANAQIESATHRISEIEDPNTREGFKKKVVELSIKHRVLSDYTALLVLETEDDYRRFNIDRKSLIDIMVVGDKGVTMMKRGGDALVKEVVVEEKAPEWLRRDRADDRQGGKGKRHKGEEGQMGKRDARKTDNHYGIKGPRDNQDPHMARSASRERARKAGILSQLSGDAPAAAPAPAAIGDDPLGSLDGVLGEAEAPAETTGRGGGGTGEGTIGIGDLNSIGHGGGGGSGAGYGRGAGGLGGRRASAPRIRSGAAEVRGSLSREVIRRIVHRHINEVRFCYERALQRRPDLAGRISVRFIISATGAVQTAALGSSTLGDAEVENCIVQAVRRWTFPQPDGGGIVVVTYPFVFTPGEGGGTVQNSAQPADGEEMPPLFQRADAENQPVAHRGMHPENPYNDRLKRVMDLLKEGKNEEAMKGAWLWRNDEPGDVLAIIGLGEVAEASGKFQFAARVYGSIIDLYPSRADLRRMAGQRLERLGEIAQDLAIDTYKQAVKQRPDHPSSHRLYGYALLQAGKYEEAFEAMRMGYARNYPGGRYAAVKRILLEDLGLIAAAWARARPNDIEKITQKCADARAVMASEPTTRFVLHWETDANDVDFHIYDARGGHAFYSNQTLSSGGSLYADVTTGYGPECFAITGRPTAFPYAMQAHYYSRGPMGYGMGKVQINEHDGKGNLWFNNQPFVIMNDGAYVGLGSLDKPLSESGAPGKGDAPIKKIAN